MDKLNRGAGGRVRFVVGSIAGVITGCLVGGLASFVMTSDIETAARSTLGLVPVMIVVVLLVWWIGHRGARE